MHTYEIARYGAGPVTDLICSTTWDARVGCCFEAGRREVKSEVKYIRACMRFTSSRAIILTPRGFTGADMESVGIKDPSQIYPYFIGTFVPELEDIGLEGAMDAELQRRGVLFCCLSKESSTKPPLETSLRHYQDRTQN